MVSDNFWRILCISNLQPETARVGGSIFAGSMSVSRRSLMILPHFTAGFSTAGFSTAGFSTAGFSTAGFSTAGFSTAGFSTTDIAVISQEGEGASLSFSGALDGSVFLTPLSIPSILTTSPLFSEVGALLVVFCSDMVNFQIVLLQGAPLDV
jgi:hypothetical protein